MTINILFPVLNEHIRLENGIEKCVDFLRKRDDVRYKLTIIDNGSDDDTPEISRRLEEKYEEVEYIRIEERGVGIAFKTGVLRTAFDIVGYMDIDLSTPLEYLGETIDLLKNNEDIQYVNGSRFSRSSHTYGRKWYRSVFSAGLIFLLKTILHMKSTDALCGFTFIRSDIAKKLVEQSSDDKGWFYTVEILLRAERDGISIYDMPVNWVEDYNTTVNIPRTIKNYIVQIYKLKKRFREEY